MKQLERIHRKLAATPQLSSVLTICGLLLVVFASMCVYSESYRSAYNVTNVLVQCVPLACVSLGQTLVIISGGIDRVRPSVCVPPLPPASWAATTRRRCSWVW